MNKQEKYKEDLLVFYMNPGTTEKAPEGFTSKVMSRIQVDPVPVKERAFGKNLVPVISAAVAFTLILTAFLFTGGKSDSLAFPVTGFLKNLKVSLPQIDLSSIFRFNLPGILVYILVGILILTMFDRALYGVFHRGKKEHNH